MTLDDSTIQDLIEHARRARLNAHVPTSGFQVGAALLAEDGRVFTGCNVELRNTLYAICAERTALVKAISEGARGFTAVAVIADSDAPVSPCGQCRQVLVDFNPNLVVIMANTRNDRVQVTTAAELLPFAYVRAKPIERRVD